MRLIIREYGRSILALLAGTFAIMLCATYLTKTLKVHFQPEGKELLSSKVERTYPVILAPEVVKLNWKDEKYNWKQYVADKDGAGYQEVYQRYCDLVKSYEDSSRQVACKKVTVHGMEQIDVQEPGRYWLLFEAENEGGHKFRKQVQVIVR